MSGADAPVALGPVDFATHVLSLASSAMMAMGQVHGPGGEVVGGDAATAPDLETAKYVIDVLGMLADKTRGNLDESEEKLLQSLLYDLRVAYVDASKGAAGAP